MLNGWWFILDLISQKVKLICKTCKPIAFFEILPFHVFQPLKFMSENSNQVSFFRKNKMNKKIRKN